MFINFSYRNVSYLIKKFTSYFKIKCQSFKLFRMFNIIAFNEIYCIKYIATDTENYVYKCLPSVSYILPKISKSIIFNHFLYLSPRHVKSRSARQ